MRWVLIIGGLAIALLMVTRCAKAEPFDAHKVVTDALSIKEPRQPAPPPPPEWTCVKITLNGKEAWVCK